MTLKIKNYKSQRCVITKLSLVLQFALNNLTCREKINRLSVKRTHGTTFLKSKQIQAISASIFEIPISLISMNAM